MKRNIGYLVLLCLCCQSTTLATVRGRAARYVGGTISSLGTGSEGQLTLESDTAIFNTKDGNKLVIPYSKVQSLEYGQKAGRRLGMALVISPLFLLSHKRKHFLTVTFEDTAGKQQGAVFELSKGIVHETLTTFESKSGKKIEYESEEAQKNAQAH